ncbi:MAG: TRAP transporter substrate-binding protein DctP [Candidatus Auribacterota bacterium]
MNKLAIRCLSFISISLIVISTAVAKDKFVLKFATIAPEGTTWMNIMREMNKEIEEQSGGRLSIRFYPGGVMGDELVVLRKMRINQIHGGGFSGVGLGEILPDVRLLDLPYLFHNNAEADYIHSALQDYYRDEYAKNGYELMGWAEVGFVYFLSQSPIEQVSDMKQSKLWVWQDDPVAQGIFNAMGISTIPLAVTDVLTSLQVGMINTVYSPPLGALALQWYTKVKYMSSFPITHSTGAVLVSKKFYDTLPPDLQEILKKSFEKHLLQLVERSRADNAEAIETLKQNGITVITPSPENMSAISGTATAASDSIAAKQFPPELYSRVKTLLNEYRSQEKQ